MTSEDVIHKKLHDILLKKISHNKDPTVAANCVKILQKVVENILTNPDVPKYRSLPSDNARIRRDIREVDGGLDFLLALGFRKKVVSFKESFTLDNDRMDTTKLKIAQTLLNEFVQRAETRRETADRMMMREKIEAQLYEKRVRQDIEEDWNNRRRKSMLARQSQERKKEEDKLREEQERSEMEGLVPMKDTGDLRGKPYRNVYRLGTSHDDDCDDDNNDEDDNDFDNDDPAAYDEPRHT
ncbi:7066_t:CDS:1 [Paraglomus occultum]|uniref:7066_t:CDS:1 n=1 Tax=Paraglomus occultum TaxID=144539 RepID=A0A9N9BXS5_9GLOM|nr:7066_t:CDS:1 [Paraglomus occultum]